MLANMVLGEGTLPYLQMETISLCPHVAFPLCECSERGISSVLSSSSKDTSIIGLVPPFRSHLTLITSLKISSPNTVPSGVRVATYESGGWA